MFLDDLKEVIKNELYVDLDKDNSRKTNVVDARNIFCGIAYDLNIYSLTEIGKKVNRKHCNVIHACRRSKDLIDFDKRYKEKYNRVFNKIVKPNVDESIINHYKFYKRMYKKYKDLVEEIKEHDEKQVTIFDNGA